MVVDFISIVVSYTDVRFRMPLICESMLKSVPSILSISFIVLGFLMMSQVQFSWVLWGWMMRIRFHFFYVWISSFLSTLFWRCCQFFSVYSGDLCKKNQMAVILDRSSVVVHWSYVHRCLIRIICTLSVLFHWLIGLGFCALFPSNMLFILLWLSNVIWNQEWWLLQRSGSPWLSSAICTPVM